MEHAMEARQVMTSPTITIGPDVPVRQAIETMLRAHVSGLPVVDAQGGLIGILSEGDLLRRAEIGTQKHRPKWLDFLLGPGRSAQDYVHSHSRRVADMMTDEPVSVTEEASLEEVVALMEKKRIKRVPVLRNDRVVGIVTRSDLLRAFLNATEATELPAGGDEQIARDLLAEIDRQNWATPGSIHVAVRDGHVTLSGTIFDERERDAIRVCAENSPGVRGVTDQMIWVDPINGSFMSPPV
jgi:CBS domain-containing protein